MKPIEIKHAIELAGSTQVEIARRCERSPQWVNRVIKNGDVSHRVRSEIARVIGKPVHEIWPEYYRKAS